MSVKTRKRRGYIIGGTQSKFYTKNFCVKQWLNALHVVLVDMYQKIYWSQKLKIGEQAFVKCAWILNWKLRDWRTQMSELIGISLSNKELKEFEKQYSTYSLITYKEWQSQPVTKNKSSSKNLSVQEKEINIQTKSYCVTVVITKKSKKFIHKLLNNVA